MSLEEVTAEGCREYSTLKKAFGMQMGGGVPRQVTLKHISRCLSLSRPWNLCRLLIDRFQVLDRLEQERGNAEVPGSGSAPKVDHSRNGYTHESHWHRYIHFRKWKLFKKQTCTLEQRQQEIHPLSPMVIIETDDPTQID